MLQLAKSTPIEESAPPESLRERSTSSLVRAPSLCLVAKSGRRVSPKKTAPNKKSEQDGHVRQVFGAPLRNPDRQPRVVLRIGVERPKLWVDAAQVRAKRRPHLRHMNATIRFETRGKLSLRLSRACLKTLLLVC